MNDLDIWVQLYINELYQSGGHTMMGSKYIKITLENQFTFDTINVSFNVFLYANSCKGMRFPMLTVHNVYKYLTV